MTKRRLATLVLVLSVAVPGGAALGAGGAVYKGKVDGDKSQKLKFKVKGGKVKNWKADIYASCFTGNHLTTVVVPSAKIKKGGKFKRRYQPVKGSETYVTLKGRVKDGKASGTIVETGSCSFEKMKWKAKKR